jgi:cell wall-associated NlpC family hydrolase
MVRAHRHTLALLACVAVLAGLAGCGEAQVGDPPGGAHGAQRVTVGASAGRGSPAGASGGTAHEVADPLEAKSYPVSGPIHHAAAATPATAAEEGFHLAAGARSTAQVKRELKAIERLRSQARLTGRAVLMTPVPGGESIGGNGTIPIPTNVPETVQKVIAGANAIADFPYVYGGGHVSFVDNSYDCSGSVSYALAAGGLLSAPETSGELEKWGVPGPGKYITVLANAGHTYMYVDGILYDTAGRSGPYASRWQVTGVDNSGYVVRHWPGL